MFLRDRLYVYTTTRVLGIGSGGPAEAMKVFSLFYCHVLVHAPASICCHLIGNSGISYGAYMVSLKADFICIFTASVLLCYSLCAWVFSETVTSILVTAAATLAIYVVSVGSNLTTCRRPVMHKPYYYYC